MNDKTPIKFCKCGASHLDGNQSECPECGDATQTNDTPSAMTAEWTFSRSGHQFKVLDPEGDTLIFVHAEAVAQIITDALNELDKLKAQLLTAEMPEVSDKAMREHAKNKCAYDRQLAIFGKADADKVYQFTVLGALSTRDLLLPYIQRLEMEKKNIKDDVEDWKKRAEDHATLNGNLQSENERLSRTIRMARGTLGYGDLNTEPETILQVRTILDKALLTHQKD